MDTRDEQKAEAHSLATFTAENPGSGGFHDGIDPVPLTPSDVLAAAHTFAVVRSLAVETGLFNRYDAALTELQRVILKFGQQCADDGEVSP